MIEWKKTPIEDVCSFVTSGGTPPTDNQDYYYEGTIPWLTTTDIHQVFINKIDTFITELGLANSSAKMIPENSVIVAMYGETAGKVGINKIPLCTNQACCNLVIDPEIADYLFVFYSLTLNYSNLLNLKQGGAQQNLNAATIRAFEIPLPPLPLQQRVAAVLGCYDALLGNYQQQIAVLEGLAQEIYREWFVRGRCPMAEVAPEGELPAGWRIATLDEVAYDTRRIIKIDDIDPDAAYVGLEHLSVKSISITSTGTPDDISSDKLAFEENDILFGKIRAYLHKVCLAHFAGVCSTDAIVIRPRIENALSFLLFTVFSERFIEYADLISNGTKMPRSEWSVLKTYQIILPNNRALAAFEQIARPMLDKIANLQKQSNYLRTTRDALLPRLLSGQLTVHEAEATLAA